MLSDVAVKFHANVPLRNTSRTSGAGTSPSLSTERNTNGLTAKSSSKAQTRSYVWRLIDDEKMGQMQR
jgi:hypothetical protein